VRSHPSYYSARKRETFSCCRNYPARALPFMPGTTTRVWDSIRGMVESIGCQAVTNSPPFCRNVTGGGEREHDATSPAVACTPHDLGTERSRTDGQVPAMSEPVPWRVDLVPTLCFCSRGARMSLRQYADSPIRERIMSRASSVTSWAGAGGAWRCCQPRPTRISWKPIRRRE
jgi:hypothetical protein